MEQEDKELLLRDLCARLSYGVKCRYQHIQYVENGKIIDINMFGIVNVDGHIKDICDIKPYLIPLSSMTEEQYNSLHELGILDNCSHSYEYVNPHIHGVSFIFKEFKTYSLELIEWLNKNHFDYRGLIERGLAIDCTNLNIY